MPIARVITVATLVALALAAPAFAQPVRGTVHGQVTMADGTGVPGIEVTLSPLDAHPIATVLTDATGTFAVVDVPLGRYHLVAAGAGLSARQPIEVRSAAPVDAVLTLAVQNSAIEVVEYAPDLLAPAGTVIDAGTLDTRPSRLDSRALPQVLAAMPGWAEEDNGLLHVRGVDDGLLYVEDGIPVYDRVTSPSACRHHWPAPAPSASPPATPPRSTA